MIFVRLLPNAAAFPDLHIDLRLGVSRLIKCEWRGSNIILSKEGRQVEWLFELLQQQSMQNNEGVSVISLQMDGIND